MTKTSYGKQFLPENFLKCFKKVLKENLDDNLFFSAKIKMIIKIKKKQIMMI